MIKEGERSPTRRRIMEDEHGMGMGMNPRMGMGIWVWHEHMSMGIWAWAYDQGRCICKNIPFFIIIEEGGRGMMHHNLRHPQGMGMPPSIPIHEPPACGIPPSHAPSSRAPGPAAQAPS